MISDEDIHKLSTLSRISVSPEEAESFRGEISSILEYVGQINKVVEKNKVEVYHSLKNVFREDRNPHETGENTEKILAEAPNREGNYVKVKKIIT